MFTQIVYFDYDSSFGLMISQRVNDDSDIIHVVDMWIENSSSLKQNVLFEHIDYVIIIEFITNVFAILMREDISYFKHMSSFNEFAKTWSGSVPVMTQNALHHTFTCGHVSRG